MSPLAPPPPNLSLAEAIESLREQTGLTKEGLGLESGIHPTEISRLVSGRRNPTLKTLKRLAKGLGVSTAQLVATEEEFALRRGGPA
jgi:transcriptional regulator with XRE-family HTH domain